MYHKIKLLTLAFVLALALALATQAPAHAAGCPDNPLVLLHYLQPEDITVKYFEQCIGEEWTKVWARTGLTGSWTVLRTDGSGWSGWRSAWHTGLTPGQQYCYKAETRKDGVTRTSAIACDFAPLPTVKVSRIFQTQAQGCGTIPTNPGEDAVREHAWITDALADEMGIDRSQVGSNGPSPQIRLTVDAPLMANGLKSTVNYTVARICTGASENDWRLHVWNLDKLHFPSGTTGSSLSVTLQTVAPSRTTWTKAGVTTVENHFAEANSGSRYFREKVVIVDSKDVALLIPHGGAIEVNTSDQLTAFVTEIGAENVNVWESDGRWGDDQTHERWHITATALHEDGFPGLARLLAEPEFDDARNQDFRYAVVFHGFDDRDGVGLILGGLASPDVLCHVANGIQKEADTRSGEIALIIANAGDNGADIEIANDLGYLPTPDDPEDIDGTSQSNLVNRVSRAQTPGDPAVTWGGIQLEQSTCLRREETCDFADNDDDGANDFCPDNEDTCLHNVVARGVARAIAELVAEVDPVNPAGACCTYFDQRCQ
jgi:phage replication-related protein YjqB (UPF0714/DUF867 family)